MPKTIIKNWNTTENFWLLNPDTRTIKVLRDLYESDKSKNKDKSSKLMWGIALLLDPNEKNIWRNVGYFDKQQLIAEEFFEDSSFDWSKHKELLSTYEFFCMGLEERELMRTEKKLVERADFISETPYSLDYYNLEGKLIKGTSKSLDDMILNTGKIYEHIEELRDKIAKSLSNKTLGSIVLSKSEKGEI